jgi:hypothetical protein
MRCMGPPLVALAWMLFASIAYVYFCHLLPVLYDMQSNQSSLQHFITTEPQLTIATICSIDE